MDAIVAIVHLRECFSDIRMSLPFSSLQEDTASRTNTFQSILKRSAEQHTRVLLLRCDSQPDGESLYIGNVKQPEVSWDRLQLPLKI